MREGGHGVSMRETSVGRQYGYGVQEENEWVWIRHRQCSLVRLGLGPVGRHYAHLLFLFWAFQAFLSR